MDQQSELWPEDTETITLEILRDYGSKTERAPDGTYVDVPDKRNLPIRVTIPANWDVKVDRVPGYNIYYQLKIGDEKKRQRMLFQRVKDFRTIGVPVLRKATAEEYFNDKNEDDSKWIGAFVGDMDEV